MEKNKQNPFDGVGNTTSSARIFQRCAKEANVDTRVGCHGPKKNAQNASELHTFVAVVHMDELVPESCRSQDSATKTLAKVFFVLALVKEQQVVFL